MRKTPISAALDNGRIRLDMGVVNDRGKTFQVGDQSIKGFWSTPSIKTELTESQISNGSHGISHKVLYASRVVSIPFFINTTDRSMIDDYRTLLHDFVGSSDVRFEVQDAVNTTYVQGMMAIEYDRDMGERNVSGTITLTCVDAERKSVYEHSSYISIYASSSGNGLSFGKGGKGLVFPMNFGKRTIQGVQNTVVLKNAGSYTADVRLIVHGELAGCVFYWSDSEGRSGTLEYTGYINPYQSVLLDSKTDSATIAGSDFSGQLSYRQFPRIPGNGDLRIMMASGANSGISPGYTEIKYNDTWM